MCLPNILFAVFMFAFIFHCRSFSPCWPLAFLIFSPPLWISMFFFLRNSSPLFSITRSSSFSVIHVSVNIKNNAEKDTTLLLFFLSKSPGGHLISFQIKPWVAFALPYLLIELDYIGMPVLGNVDSSCISFCRASAKRQQVKTSQDDTKLCQLQLSVNKSQMLHTFSIRILFVARLLKELCHEIQPN